MDNVAADNVHMNGDVNNCRLCRRIPHRALRRHKEPLSKFHYSGSLRFEFGIEFWLLLLVTILTLYILYLSFQLRA